jgi:hypothetical protein
MNKPESQTAPLRYAVQKWDGEQWISGGDWPGFTVFEERYGALWNSETPMRVLMGNSPIPISINAAELCRRNGVPFDQLEDRIEAGERRIEENVRRWEEAGELPKL